MPRIPRCEFEQLPLRVHTVLAGIPLYDVWAIDLRHWHSGITLRQFLEAAPLHSMPTSPATRFLIRIRLSIGKMFGWDGRTSQRNGSPASRSKEAEQPTFVSRLSASDHESSMIEPGTMKKGLRVVYSFANEHLVEMRNKTVHGALAVALVEREGSYRLYLGVFAFSVSRLTPSYMAVIAPFRHWIVYPSLLRGFHKRWNETFGPPPDSGK